MDTKNNFTVSVVMCTYNGEKYIREQIDSILQQTYSVDEIIIQDDCSTDGTCEVLYEYQQRYSQIQVIRNKRNIGINPNFFSAIARAKGDYIAIADQDDIWELDKIELQLKFIGDKLLCAGRTTPFSTDGSAVRVDGREPNISLLRQMFIGTIAGHTILFHRNLLGGVNIDEITTVGMYDSLLSMLAMAHNSVVFIDRTIVRQRRYSSAATYNVPTDNQMTILNIIKNIKQTWKYNKRLKPEIRRRLSITLNFLENINSQEKILKEAIRMLQLYISPSSIDFNRLIWFCICHKEQLFYPRYPKKGLISVLRAAYFPISLSEYYRYL